MDRSLAPDCMAIAQPSGPSSYNRDSLPARPAPAAQPHSPYGIPSSTRHIQSVHDPEQHTLYYYGHEMPPGSSVSSAGGSSLRTAATVDTIDLGKAGSAPPWIQQPQDIRRSSAAPKDKRKQEMVERNNPYSGSASNLPHHRPSLSSVADEDDVMIEEHPDIERKAMKILLFLCAPCAILSTILCIYSLLATFILLLAHPFRLCVASRASLEDRLLSTLSSSIRIQLRCIYTSTNLEGRSVSSLLLGHILAPFLSMGVAVAAWTVAIYWGLAAIVGDPDGSEGGDDGRATVLGLRRWWEARLEKPLRS